MKNYLDINRESWDKKVEPHQSSEFYFMEEFMAGKNSLNSIELALMGDVKGKKILHLQCHFGQDSLSLARMGAKVTGVDFSPKAIERAKLLAKELGQEVDFILSDVYQLPEVLKGEFDMVFTSFGVLGWLRSMKDWARVVSHFLKPQGKLFLIEFHPFVWMYDEDFTHLKYSYFNQGPIVEEFEGTYANREADIKNKYVSWNHPLSDIFSSLISADIELLDFKEYNYSPYDCFKQNKKIADRKFQIPILGAGAPHVYSLVGVKK